MSRKNFISEYLIDESLDSITKAIGEIEKRSSGEKDMHEKENGLSGEEKAGQRFSFKTLL